MSEARQNPKPPKPRRRFRFGLKTLLLFTAVVAIWLGIITNRANRQRRAAEAITEHGDTVLYDYQGVRGQSADAVQVRLELMGPRPEWLRYVLGDHFFITATSLYVEQQATIDENRLAYLRDLPDIERLSIHRVSLRNEDLAHFRHLTKLRSVLFGPDTLSAIDGKYGFEFLSRCPDLEVLSLSSPNFGDEAAGHLSRATNARSLYLYDTAIGDEGLAHFKAMKDLETLSLARTRVGDDGLANLKPLTKLTYLSLDGTQVTDAGLEHLKSLTNLQTLELWKTKVTKQGLSDLKAAMPNCKVVP